MLLVEQAQKEIIEASQCTQVLEKVELLDVLHKIAAQDINSSINVPLDDNSAMDGYVLCASDLSAMKQNEPVLTVSQRIPAGSVPKPLTKGTVARIFTGGIIPPNADAVIIQENCEVDSQNKTVKLLTKVTAGDNIRKAGQDIKTGEVIIKKGTQLTPQHIGLIASIGLAEVTVYKPLKVVILSTGEELVEQGKPLKAGQIYNSNRAMLIALCQQLGYVPIDCGIVSDSLEATKNALVQAAKSADVIISTGGVSVGEEDHIKAAVESLGSLDFCKVRMKPGKPVVYGKVQGTPFVGLPGNPVSSFVVFNLLVKPMLASLQGQCNGLPETYSVIAGFDKKEVKREEYIRVRLLRDENGDLIAQAYDNQSSGVLSSLTWADGFVKHTIGSCIEHGKAVEFLPI